ncbi:MAG: DUF1178 family protein [Thermodesulfobacteriota bacterium]
MIVFDLACDCSCQFEGWFDDSTDFYRQEKDGLLRCPACGSHHVKKILSPVAVKSGERRETLVLPQDISPEQVVADALSSLHDYVIKNYEDVGTNLAEESLKIHYGVKAPRNIRGTSTEEEEKVLKKEGIKILKVPLPAKDDKKTN